VQGLEDIEVDGEFRQDWLRPGALLEKIHGLVVLAFQDEQRDYFERGIPNPYEECRYKAHEKGVVEKCDFCRERLSRGDEPSCVANCMCKARIFGDLDDPQSEVSRLIREDGGFQLNPELGTDPSVYYLPPDRK